MAMKLAKTHFEVRWTNTEQQERVQTYSDEPEARVAAMNLIVNAESLWLRDRMRVQVFEVETHEECLGIICYSDLVKQFTTEKPIATLPTIEAPPFTPDGKFILTTDPNDEIPF